MTKAAEEKPPKDYVFWEGDGQDPPSKKPYFGPPLLSPLKLKETVRDLRYRAGQRVQLVSSTRSQQENVWSGDGTQAVEAFL